MEALLEIKKCRLCLTNAPNLLPIGMKTETHLSIGEIFTSVTGYEIQEGDPHLVCGCCWSNLEMAYNLLNMCHETERTLRKQMDSFLVRFEAEEPQAWSDFHEIKALVKEELDVEEASTETGWYSPPPLSFRGEEKPSENPADPAVQEHLKRLPPSIIVRKTRTTPKPESPTKMILARLQSQGVCIKKKQPKRQPNGQPKQSDCNRGENIIRTQQVPIKSSQSRGTASNKLPTSVSKSAPNVCGLCGVAMKNFSSLECHMKMHHHRPNSTVSGERFFCDICFRSFMLKSLLVRHLLSHETIRPGGGVKERKYSCSVCSKTFKTSKNLRVHSNIHKEEKDYECPVCSAGFSTGQNMRNHVERLHPEYDMPPKGTILNKRRLQRDNYHFHEYVHGAKLNINKKPQFLLSK